MQYKLSRFLKNFSRGDVIALYHSLTMELAFIKQCAYEKVVSNPDLVELGFLVPTGRDELVDFKKRVAEIQNKRAISVLYMMLTDGCNLSCTYCFEDTHEIKEFRSVLMREHISHAALDLTASLIQKYPLEPERCLTIQFYGGEPLLNFPVLRSSVLYAEELIKQGLFPSNTEIAMVTNGVLLDPHRNSERAAKMAEFFAKHEISVGISLDGPKEIHDTYRVNKSNAGSFQSALAGYRLLADCGVKVGVSCTLTPKVVDNFSEVLAFFENELGIKQGLSFNILHYTPSVAIDGCYYEKVAECILQAFPRFRDSDKWEDRMMRKAESFAYQEMTFADCAAIGHQLVISPEGQIGICQDFIKPRKYFNHSVFDKKFDPYEDENFQEWLRRSPLNMPQCQDCEAIAICGGGCPASAQALYGSIWDVDRRICPFSKKALEWLIWETYDKLE